MPSTGNLTLNHFGAQPTEPHWLGHEAPSVLPYSGAGPQCGSEESGRGGGGGGAGRDQHSLGETGCVS